MVHLGNKVACKSRSAYQSMKNSFVYIYALIEQGTHEWNLKTKSIHSGECCPHTNTNFATDIRLAGNLNKEQLIRQWIDSDENIAKLGWYYASSIIAAVFRPDNVNFVVAQMSRLYQSIQVVKRKQVHQCSITYLLKESVFIVRRHSSRYVKNHFRERSGKVRSRFTGGTIPLQTTKKASVRFQFNLIKKLLNFIWTRNEFNYLKKWLTSHASPATNSSNAWLPQELVRMEFLSSWPAPT